MKGDLLTTTSSGMRRRYPHKLKKLKKSSLKAAFMKASEGKSFTWMVLLTASQNNPMKVSMAEIVTISVYKTNRRSSTLWCDPLQQETSRCRCENHSELKALQRLTPTSSVKILLKVTQVTRGVTSFR